jgi:hypothetical protein
MISFRTGDAAPPPDAASARSGFRPPPARAGGPRGAPGARAVSLRLTGARTRAQPTYVLVLLDSASALAAPRSIAMPSDRISDKSRIISSRIARPPSS